MRTSFRTGWRCPDWAVTGATGSSLLYFCKYQEEQMALLAAGRGRCLVRTEPIGCAPLLVDREGFYAARQSA